MTTIVRREAPKSPKLSTKLVIYWAERMLAELDRSEAELSVFLTDDRTIAELNRDYRQKDQPTDVLSFHFEPVGAPSTIEAGWLLGDIVISLDTAARQAQSRKRSLEDEVRWLLSHGLLHLVGYDHATPAEKRVMVALTGKLVRAAGDAPQHLISPAKPSGKRRVTNARVTKSSATTRAAKTSATTRAAKTSATTRAAKTSATTRAAKTSAVDSAPKRRSVKVRAAKSGGLAAASSARRAAEHRTAKAERAPSSREAKAQRAPTRRPPALPKLPRRTNPMPAQMSRKGRSARKK